MGTLVDVALLPERFEPGASLYLGGMTLYRRPVALVRALIRSGADRLTLLTLTAGYESDLLVGAGRVQTVRTCYFGLEAFGLAPMYTRATREGTVRVVEESEATLAQGLRAALAGTGFMPARALLGTDLMKVRPDLRTVHCPYTGQEVLAVPALVPDVALIHVPMADTDGNCILGANHALDREAAALATVTIVSAERVVEPDELPQGQVDLPALAVDLVVEARDGAWPTSCWPDYGVDGREILRYIDHAASDGFAPYLEAFIDGAEALQCLPPPARPSSR